ISYGSDFAAQFGQAAVYIDRILKGATPAALPIQAPTKFEMIINLKTAKALGLDVPPLMLGRADDVIESLLGLLRCMSPLLAQSGHHACEFQCPLAGVSGHYLKLSKYRLLTQKRTWHKPPRMSGSDPFRTLTGCPAFSLCFNREAAGLSAGRFLTS